MLVHSLEFEKKTDMRLDPIFLTIFAEDGLDFWAARVVDKLVVELWIDLYEKSDPIRPNHLDHIEMLPRRERKLYDL